VHTATLFHKIFSLFAHEHHLKNTHPHAMDATEHTTLSSSQNIKEEYV